MRYFIIAFSFVFLFIISLLDALSQTADSSIYILEIDVNAPRLEKESGFKKTVLDSALLSDNETNNLGELLSAHSPVYIKSYGQGALATASFRGANSSHTQVQWNGVAINSPMLGQMDFSLIPVFFIDDVVLFHGMSATSNSNGALGGTINLKTRPDFLRSFSLKANQSIGSFNSYQSAAAFATGNQNWQSKTRIYYLTSENNFPYTNRLLSKDSVFTERRKHAAYTQKGLMQELYYRPKTNHLLTVRFWVQENQREIPTSMVVTGLQQDEQQNSRFFRTMADWTIEKTRWKLHSSVAYLHEYLHYTRQFFDENGDFNPDSHGNINSKNTTHTLQFSFDADWYINPRSQIKTGISNIYNGVNSVNYTRIKNRNHASVYANFTRQLHQRLSLFVLLRQEIIDAETAPVIPALGINYQVFKDKNLFLKTNISRNFHYPSLNDLYWQPGGNPDLKAENGWAAELGLLFEQQFDNECEIESELTAYYANISNWIVWQPSAAYYWSPVNYKQVVSRGLEADFRFKGSWQGIKASVNTGYTLTFATNQKALPLSDNTAGKQLIYVPKHQFYGQITAEKGNFFIGYSHNYTALRYTTSDNHLATPPYQLGNFTVGVSWPFTHFSLGVNAKVNNMWDTSYQAVQYYPMPGRSYQLQLRLSI